MSRRNAAYDLLKIFDKFEAAPYDCLNGTSGNIRWIIEGQYSLETKGYTGGILNGKALYEAVSAPMLLARLVAAGFTPHVNGQEGYKTTWEFVLRHKRSGKIVTFYDYKGGSSIGSNTGDSKTAKVFLDDVKALVLALTNDRFPHPYDGCVVGEVA